MVIANQLIASRENLLEKLQSGFKHAFIKAIRDCLLAADGKKTPVLILTDLSADFDTTDHAVLPLQNETLHCYTTP